MCGAVIDQVRESETKSESRSMNMHTRKNTLLLTAAFAGLVSGTAVRAAQPMPSGLGSALPAGLQADEKKDIEKHACKGLNSCKGNGGGSNKEWGKNSCKGQGACATDGSKK
jgi:hypothetical protein